MFAIGQSVVSLWGALFYLFFRSLVNSNNTLRHSDLLHIVPALLSFLFIYVRYGSWSGFLLYFQESELFKYPEVILATWFDILIIFYVLKAFHIYWKLIRQQSNEQVLFSGSSRLWLRLVLYGYMFSSGIVVIHDVFRQFSVHNASRYHLLLSYTVFLVYFSALFYVSICRKIIFGHTETKMKYSRSKMNEKEAEQMLQELEKYMVKEVPYIDPELNLQSMAADLHISYRQLSQLVNTHKQQNFSDYINSYRIQYAKQLLEQPEYASETIYAVLVESGFNSKTSFNQAFKKWVGCTPIQYKKQFHHCLSD